VGDPGTLEEHAERFSFYEKKNRGPHALFCSLLRETVSDKDVLLSAGSIVLPLATADIIATFFSSLDDTTRTSLPKEIRIAMTSHKAHFFTRGLALVTISSIQAPATMIFQATLLTFL